MPYKNKDDQKKHRREKYRRNRDKELAQANAWNRNNTDRRRSTRRFSKYGLTDEQYMRMVEEQNGKCYICSINDLAVVDHDHTTGKVRKLLCARCNGTIGYVHEDVTILERMIKYLREH